MDNVSGIKKGKGKSKMFIIIGGVVAALLVIILYAWGSSPALGEYKERATPYTSAEFLDGNVDGGKVVELSGEISAHNGDAFVLTDSDGVFYVKDENEAGGSFSDGDNVTVYGQYIGDEKETGFPKIVAKIIE